MPQAKRLFQVRDPDVGRTQPLGDPSHLDEPVAVGVRLQDRHHARGRDVGGDGPVVPGEDVEIDLDVGRAEPAGRDGRLVEGGHGRWRSPDRPPTPVTGTPA